MEQAPRAAARAKQVRAFAKLQGRDFCFYLGVNVELGRRLKKGQAKNQANGEVQRIDVTTDDKSVSRRHAVISYCSAEKEFELRVIGKNGVFVNGLFVSPSNNPVRLRSQSEIILGKPCSLVSMTFLLPMAVRPSQNVGQKRPPQNQARKVNLTGLVADAILNEPLQVQAITDKVSFHNASVLYEWGLADPVLLRHSVCHVLSFHDYFAADEEAQGWARWRLTAHGQARFAKPQPGVGNRPQTLEEPVPKRKRSANR